jgi:phenylpropionate dioxygenase-like ring-hydroxylating dioxygenase large terminal subunit
MGNQFPDRAVEDFRRMTGPEGLDILRREWLAIARSSDIPQAGDYLSFDMLSEPIALVRQKDGSVAGLSNVCRHRMATLLDGSGNTRTLVCPYHRWTYGLDGRFVGAPCMKEHRALTETQNLPRFDVAEWQGWIFIRLEGEGPFPAHRFDALEPRFDERGIGSWVTAGWIDYPSPWNWALMIENFSESYHHLAVHTETLQPFWPAAETYAVDSGENYAELRHPVDPEQGTFTVFTLFPLLAFAVQDPLPVVVWPRIIVRDRGYFDLRMYLIVDPSLAADAALIDGLRAVIDRIHREDIPLMERVWRGTQSRFAGLGPLSDLERPLELFRDYMAKRLPPG